MTSPETDRGRLMLVSGETHPQLAKDIARELDTELDPVTLETFANSELYVRHKNSVRGADVFVIQSHAAIGGKSVNDSIMQQRLLIDAARRGSAKEITVVAPHFAYLRQDRKAKGREPISASMIIQDFVNSGAGRIMSVDIHSEQVQGFINKPFDALVAQQVLVDWIRNWKSENSKKNSEVVLVSPDAGRAELVEDFAQELNIDWVNIIKKRSKETRKAEAVGVLGEVAGRHCIIVDDMIDTAGTLVAAAEMLKKKRAASVTAIATHGILSDPAAENITDSAIDRVVVTDTLPTEHHLERIGDTLEVVTMAPKIAAAIREVHEEGSVSEVFNGKNAS